MTKVAPFHTKSTEYTEAQRKVHHDCECSDAKKIKPEHRESGMAGKPKCEECATTK